MSVPARRARLRPVSYSARARSRSDAVLSLARVAIRMAETRGAAESDPDVMAGTRYSLPAWLGPSPGIAPAVVPLRFRIAQTDALSLWFLAVYVFPEGFELELLALASPDHVAAISKLIAQTCRSSDGEQGLGLRFEYSDGSVALATPDVSVARPSSPMIQLMSGGGGGGIWRYRYWVWPLPPRGPLKLTCDCPSAGIRGARSEFDAGELIDASARAEVVFRRTGSSR